VLPFEFLFHGLGGSTIATVDRSGTTGTALSYAPFGELLETINDASGERHRLNDKYVDEISNLGYYGARYYDTTSMTWTQADPSFRFAPDDGGEQPRLAMLYTNDLNNPLRYVDPDGRAPLGQIIADGVKAGEEVLDAVVTNVVLAKGSGPVIAAGAATGGTVIAETVGVTAAEAGGTGLMAGLGMFVVAPLGGAYLAYKICDQPGTGKPDPMQGTGNGSHDDGEPPDLVRLPKLPKNKPRHWPRGEKFPPDPPGTVTKVPRAKRVPPKGWLRRWWEKVFGGAKTNSTTTTHDKPADANKDGTVTKDEEATWMSEQNNQIQ
jgi:RHS repeat-associated protein